jgi:transcription-repair coupling factor (superfamily II helicase)
MAELRLLAARWQVATVHLEKPPPGSSEPTYVVLGYRNPKRMKALAAQSRGRLRIVDESSAYLPLQPEETEPQALYECLKDLLRG